MLCRDVAAVYRHFPYPLEHLGGRLTLEEQRLSLDLHGLIGDRPARLTGTIDNPGPDAIVRLDIQAESVPIDDAFLAALRPDVRKVVNQFHPAGSVKAQVRVARRPMVGPGAKPEGHLVIDADLDLNPRCEITWAGLPYPIRNLTGRLEAPSGPVGIQEHARAERPGGHHGQRPGREAARARCYPNGEPPLKIDLQIQAENLPFNDDLRRALPAGLAEDLVDHQPDREPATSRPRSTSCPAARTSTISRSRPGPSRAVRLVVHRAARSRAIDPGGTIELRMENVRGRFDFDNGKVVMHDVNFFFHGAPVQFASGDVVVEDSGRFALAVSDLWVKEIRFDSSLRKIMPPLMAQFAMRLDDGRPFTARGNLQIGWSGVSGEPAWCRWDRDPAVFERQQHQGAASPGAHPGPARGRPRLVSNGQALEVHGIVRLASVSLMGQQITELESPFHVERGLARLDSLQRKLLGGELLASGSISLDDTPKYSASLRPDGRPSSRNTPRRCRAGSLTAAR